MTGREAPPHRSRPPRVLSALARVRSFETHGELFALALLLTAPAFMPRGTPIGIYGLGIVDGSTLALHALALVLIYRSNRIINFAQAAFGLSAAMLFSSLVHYRSLLELIDPLCVSGCVDNPVAVHVNYWVALVLTLAVVAFLGWATYVLVVRRFSTASPLVLTVGTIFIGAIVTGFTSELTQRLVPSEIREGGGPDPGIQPVALPFDFTLQIGNVTFHAVEVLTVAVALGAAAALFFYLRRSATGTAIRAAADNAERASSLGVDVGSVTARVWMIGAGLAAAAGILSVMSQGIAGAGGAANAEIRILAAVVLARMVSLPLAAAAGIVLGIVAQAVQWSFDSTVLLDGTLFLLIGVLLLLRASRRRRSEQVSVEDWRAAEEIRPIPPKLRVLPVVRAWWRFGVGLLTVVLVAFPWMTSPATTDLAAAVLAYMMIALSVLILTGWAGQISLGQVGFAAIGAYVTAVSGLPFPISLLTGAAAGAFAAMLVGLPALRIRGLHLAIMTLAFHQAVVAIGLSPRYLGRFLPADVERPVLLGIDLDDRRAFFYLTLLLTIVVVLAVLGLRRGRTARALLATRDNEHAAQSFGIGVTRARVGAFAVSGAIAAFAGAVLAYQQGGVQPTAFGLGLSRTIFLHTVIGGLGTVAGPVLGLVYYALPLFFTLPGLVALMMSGPGGLILLLTTPGGLAQLVFGARDGWLRRIARRNRISDPSLFGGEGFERRDERAPLAPKTRPGGGAVFVPVRYELPAQWAVAKDGARVAVAERPGGDDDA